MHLISARNVHEALPMGLHYIYRHGVLRESRNGEVLIAPVPVTTLYQSPSEMCCFWSERNVNPFATLFEGLWMLNGQNDVAYLTRFIKRFAEFSDDGETLHGAYGLRWRAMFGFDQLAAIGSALKDNPHCRRQVLQIWSAEDDLVGESKDKPCNLTIKFDVNIYGSLDMVVFNRSNDLVWGTYGADAPHFGMLLQYVAARADLNPGRYWQVSSNYHAYLKTVEPLKELQRYARVEHYDRCQGWSPYDSTPGVPLDIMANCHNPDDWDGDLRMFMEEEDKAMGYRTWFFRRVAVPLIQAHNLYKADDLDEAIKLCENVPVWDWSQMCSAWLKRIKEKRSAKEDNQSD